MIISVITHQSAVDRANHRSSSSTKVQVSKNLSK